MTTPPQLDLPHSLQAERTLLGGLMRDPSALDRLGFPPSVFYRPLHQTIYQAMKDLRDMEGPVTAEAIVMRVGETTEGEGGGLAYLAELYTQGCLTPEVEYWAEQVVALDDRRAKIVAAYNLAETLSNGGDPEAMASAERGMATALGDAGLVATVSREDRHAEFMDHYRAGSTFIQTPILDINSYLGGLPLGESIVIGGRSGSGKSALALFLSVRAAIDGHGVLVLSLEQNRNELRKRMLAQLSYIADIKQDLTLGGALRWERAPPDEVNDLSALLTDLPIWVEDKYTQSATLQRVAKSYLHRRPISMVVLDHAQKVRDDSVRGDSKERLTIGELSRWWYRLAKDHQVAAVLVSQCNRGPEQGAKRRRPRVADLKASGDLEQDADKVLLTHVEDQSYEWGEIIVGKDRSGSAADRVVKYRRNARFLSFENWSDRED